MSERNFTICGICNKSLVGGFNLFRAVYPAIGDTNKQQEYIDGIFNLSGSHHRKCVLKLMRMKGFSNESCRNLMNYRNIKKEFALQENKDK